MSLVEHARRELIALGEFESDPAYAQSIVATVAAFASYGHSGGSAGIAVEVLHDLLQFKNLTPLTDDPEEWEDRSEMSGYPLWQNKRNSSAFSTDVGRTYWLLSSEEAAAPDQVGFYNSKHVEL